MGTDVGLVGRLLSAIREKNMDDIFCIRRIIEDDLLTRDVSFWFSDDKAQLRNALRSFYEALWKDWTVEETEDEIDDGLSWAISVLAGMYRTGGDYDEARRLYQIVLEITSQRAERYPDSIERQDELGISYRELGENEAASGNDVQARRYFELSRDTYERIVATAPDNEEYHTELGVVFEWLGDIELKAGKTAFARAYFDKTHRIFERQARQTPESAGAQDRLATINQWLDYLDSIERLNE